MRVRAQRQDALKAPDGFIFLSGRQQHIRWLEARAETAKKNAAAKVTGEAEGVLLENGIRRAC